jgi:hypothetical protein
MAIGITTSADRIRTRDNPDKFGHQIDAFSLLKRHLRLHRSTDNRLPERHRSRTMTKSINGIIIKRMQNIATAKETTGVTRPKTVRMRMLKKDIEDRMINMSSTGEG